MLSDKTNHKFKTQQRAINYALAAAAIQSTTIANCLNISWKSIRTCVAWHARGRRQYRCCHRWYSVASRHTVTVEKANQSLANKGHFQVVFFSTSRWLIWLSLKQLLDAISTTPQLHYCVTIYFSFFFCWCSLLENTNTSIGVIRNRSRISTLSVQRAMAWCYCIGGKEGISWKLFSLQLALLKVSIHIRINVHLGWHYLPWHERLIKDG